MVQVKFFGLMRIHSQVKAMSVSEGSVKDIIEAIVKVQPQIEKEALLQCLIIHNSVQINGSKHLKITIRDGDELVFLSPASGG